MSITFFIVFLLPLLLIGFIYETYLLDESELMHKVGPFFKYIFLILLYTAQEYFMIYITFKLTGFVCFQYVLCLSLLMVSRKFALLTGIITPVIINVFLLNIGQFSNLKLILSFIAVITFFLAMSIFVKKSFLFQFFRYTVVMFAINLITINPIKEHTIVGFYNVESVIRVFGGCVILMLLSYVFFKEVELKKQHLTELEFKKSHDVLTGLYNYREFRKNINLIADNDEENVIAVMFDIDDFKKFNDTYGHNEGNHVLEKFARAIQDEILKKGDCSVKAYRFGGEEFCVLVNEISVVEVNRRIKNFVKRVKTHPYRTEQGQSVLVTCSAGLADRQNFLTIYETIRAADDALYKAKKEGKGKVIVNFNSFETDEFEVLE